MASWEEDFDNTELELERQKRFCIFFLPEVEKIEKGLLDLVNIEIDQLQRMITEKSGGLFELLFEPVESGRYQAVLRCREDVGTRSTVAGQLPLPPEQIVLGQGHMQSVIEGVVEWFTQVSSEYREEWNQQVEDMRMRIEQKWGTPLQKRGERSEELSEHQQIFQDLLITLDSLDDFVLPPMLQKDQVRQMLENDLQYLRDVDPSSEDTLEATRQHLFGLLCIRDAYQALQYLDERDASYETFYLAYLMKDKGVIENSLQRLLENSRVSVLEDVRWRNSWEIVVDAAGYLLEIDPDNKQAQEVLNEAYEIGEQAQWQIAMTDIIIAAQDKGKAEKFVKKSWDDPHSRYASARLIGAFGMLDYVQRAQEDMKGDHYDESTLSNITDGFAYHCKDEGVKQKGLRKCMEIYIEKLKSDDRSYEITMEHYGPLYFIEFTDLFDQLPEHIRRKFEQKIEQDQNPSLPTFEELESKATDSRAEIQEAGLRIGQVASAAPAVFDPRKFNDPGVSETLASSFLDPATLVNNAKSLYKTGMQLVEQPIVEPAHIIS